VEIYDSDDDVIPCDDDGNYLATAELQDEASSHNSEFLLSDNPDDASVTLEGSDSTKYSAEGWLHAIQQNLSYVPLKIRNLTSFFNPNPESE
jgi:hypothetical protein